MQHENSNSQNWKQKLENIESLPAEMRMNKELAWEKLHQKLQQKPQRKKAVLYWAAAACLLPLLFVLLLPAHQTQNRVTKNITPANVIAKPRVKEIKSMQKETAVAIATKPFTKKKKETKKSEDNIVITEKNSEQMPDISTDSMEKSEDAIAGNYNDNNPVNTTRTTQIKKTLQVVHINELGDPAEASADMAHNIYRHSLPFQIAKGEIYSNPLQSAYKTSFISFKTKASTN